jgi:hypothetical protein
LELLCYFPHGRPNTLGAALFPLVEIVDHIANGPYIGKYRAIDGVFIQGYLL